jgi:hypothetical protein
MCRMVPASAWLTIGFRLSKRERAAHPHALALGGRDLVADAFTDHFALGLRERQQQVEA